MSFPESLEDYYQEIGRTGRNGQPATCTLFFKHADRSFHLYHIMQIQDKEYQEHKYKLLNQMVMYCDSNMCRHKLILAYFEEDVAECEDHCDSCADNRTKEPNDLTFISKMIVEGLSTIQEKQKKVTVLLLIQFLLGSSANDLKVLSLDVANGFGIAKPYYRQKKWMETAGEADLPPYCCWDYQGRTRR